MNGLKPARLRRFRHFDEVVEEHDARGRQADRFTT